MPRALWLLPLTVALLRGLPYWFAVGVDPGPNEAALPVGYLPKDFLQYLAFMRQGADGVWLASNPFTTEAQGGRFFLPFFAALGALAQLLGTPLPLMLEAARVPLLFALFALVWRLCGALLTEHRERVAACLLIAFAGGVEGPVRVLAAWLPLPEAVATPLLLDTWPLYGWNTFQLAYNPLWIAGLCLELIVLEALFRARTQQRVAMSLALAPCFLALWWTHPYSALATLGVLASIAVANAALAARVREPVLRVAVALAPAALVIAPFAAWQNGDAIYRLATANVFGGRGLPPFWYPLTLGALAWLALEGARQWQREGRAHGAALLGWTLGISLLHSSPVLNGYHFVSQLHLPLCIAAAPALVKRFDAWQRGDASRVAPLIAALALFATPIFSTAEALRDAVSESRISSSEARVIERLAGEAAANVMAPPSLANALPAFTPHRVWVGHHFLTPDYHARARRQRHLLNTPGNEAALRDLIDAQRIDYLIAAAAQAPRLAAALATRVHSSETIGATVLLGLRHD